MKKYIKYITLILSAIFLTLSLAAETITFNADSMSGVAGDKNSHTTLSGKAMVNTSSVSINADTIEMYGKDFRFIRATGTVSGINTESQLNFTCGKFMYDRETKLITLEQNVHLVDQENNVTADAELIEFNEKTNISIMQINVKLVQKDNVCKSSYAVYNKNLQTLDMSGNPEVTQGNDKFKAQQISLNLETQEITLDGRVRGSVTSTESDTQNTETVETTSDNAVKTSSSSTSKKTKTTKKNTSKAK